MKQKISILLLLCVAILLPSIATAQFFEKQKVVVWKVFDRNNDVKVSQGVKTEIQQYLIEALSSSYNYQPYEGSLASVEAKLTAQGLPEIPSNVAKVIKSVLKVDYVIFTTVKIMNHSTSYNNFDIHLTSEFYSTETLKGERMAYVDMKSDMSLIPSKCQELASKLLGENLTLKNSANQTQQQTSSPEDDEVFIKVEQMPSFQGGDLLAFRNWVGSQIRYPQLAQENGISGRVLVSFVIDRDGYLVDIRVLQTPDACMSEEVIRVLKTSPRWIPGMQRNKRVRVRYTLPVDFSIIQDGDEKKKK